MSYISYELANGKVVSYGYFIQRNAGIIYGLCIEIYKRIRSQRTQHPQKLYEKMLDIMNHTTTLWITIKKLYYPCSALDNRKPLNYYWGMNDVEEQYLFYKTKTSKEIFDFIEERINSTSRFANDLPAWWSDCTLMIASSLYNITKNINEFKEMIREFETN